MTETRKWTAGAVVVALLILVSSWFLLISPKRAEVADLEAQAQAQADANGELEMAIELLRDQNKSLPEKQAELAALKTKIPETAELPAYIREMQDLGAKSGVAFTSMTPSPPAALGTEVSTAGTLTPDALASVNVEMIVSGGYFEIVDFMNELETAPRYTLIGGYTIAAEEAEETSGSATGGGTSLTATLNARIYLAPSADTLTDAVPAPDAESTAP